MLDLQLLDSSDQGNRIKFDGFELFEDDLFSQMELVESMSHDAYEYLGLLEVRDTTNAPVRSAAKMPTQRKRSYEQRKIEMDTLTKELKVLEAKLDYCKHCAGITDERSVTQQSVNNAMLHELLRSQQFLLAGLKSILGNDRSEHVLCPLSTTVHLGRDSIHRSATLQAMRYQKLHDAARFMEKRTQFNCLATRFSETSRFQDELGNTFAAAFDIFPLYLAESAKQVYDAVLFNWFNLEICMTDLFGDVTVREEDDTGDASASHHRLVYYNRDGVAVETNNVLFSEYKGDDQSDDLLLESAEPIEEAIFVSDSVDEDELYPYRPQERVRKDATGVIRIKLVNVPAKQSADSNSNSNKRKYGEDPVTKPMVVLTRWVQWKLHACELDIPEEQLANLTEESGRASEALLNAVCISIKGSAYS